MNGMFCNNNKIHQVEFKFKQWWLGKPCSGARLWGQWEWEGIAPLPWQHDCGTDGLRSNTRETNTADAWREPWTENWYRTAWAKWRACPGSSVCRKLQTLTSLELYPRGHCIVVDPWWRHHLWVEQRDGDLLASPDGNGNQGKITCHYDLWTLLLNSFMKTRGQILYIQA